MISCSIILRILFRVRFFVIHFQEGGKSSEYGEDRSLRERRHRKIDDRFECGSSTCHEGASGHADRMRPQSGFYDFTKGERFASDGAGSGKGAWK